MTTKHFLFFALLILGVGANAQQTATSSGKPYSYIIKGGHVVDPKNNINEIMDVAITAGTRAQAARPANGNNQARAAVSAVEGKVAMVAKNINANLADQVIDAKGLYVTPGLIDIHVHFFWGHDGSYLKNAATALPADGFTFRSGVTTVVDAGCTGWRDFELYKKQTIDASKTRVMAMLNIVGTGMDGAGENNINEMDPKKAAEVAKKYPNDIVGFKIAHFSGRTWEPIDRLMEAGRLANLPVMVDFGSSDPYLPLDTLFNVKFRSGDIYTHAFGGNGSSNPNGRESIVDMNGKVKPFVYKARDRGIVFDIGFGGASYLYNQGVPAVKAGFFPTTISSDLHTGSMNGPMKSMENLMGLFMATGMPLKDVVAASTWHPAKAIKREELGNLSVGSVADIAIFKVNDGKFGWPVRGGKIEGTQRFQTEMTLRDGNVVYDLNGIAQPAGPTPER
ncbi:amidohydrolase/deacetylase family metallohydrolase [Daejeonella sp.]|jgi:dihydroorotase|uniref:amidohydrolase/deacetylase family metallohydrolase n=1 Tax=Daejeonella sp. TaxID=2805397 RepID=UPI003784DE60